MHTYTIAQFITNRIKVIDKSQKDIAREAGFQKPNMITMIKQGRTRLPLDKIGPMAVALEMDPVQLLKMWLKEYQPMTWKMIAPLMDLALTEDELRLLNTLRSKAGSSFLSAINEESKLYFNKSSIRYVSRQMLKKGEDKSCI